MRIVIGVLCTLVLRVSICFAQNGNFCGSVQSKLLPVEFAVVKCLDNNVGMTANEKGEFCFDNFPSGDFLFEISCLGFNRKIEMVHLPMAKAVVFELDAGTFQANEVIISATRASTKQASTFQLISKRDLERLNVGQDFPYVFQYTPSAVNTSDAGAGVGYTSIRIRGSDASRINATVNGVPVNDAESQGTFWVDFPDLVSSAQSVQIQRGVGTSSNGSGAFGASINIQTLAMRDTAYAESNNSVGSFNTLKNTIMFGSGLVSNCFTLNGRLSRIVSDGFIDRASSNMRSLYLDASYFGKKMSLQYVNFSGLEKTYQAWNGIPQAKVDGDSVGLLNHYYNNVGYLYTSKEDSVRLFSDKNDTYNYFSYPNQTDNYAQYNHQLHFTYNFNKHLFLNATAHTTKGLGYYEEYRNLDDLNGYGIDAAVVGSDTIRYTNLVRQKWLNNDFYGITYALNGKYGKWNTIVGGASNQYFGRHYTNIVWAEFASKSNALIPYQWNTALKDDHSIYLKNVYSLNEKFSFYTDFQFRNIDYTFQGFNAFGQAAVQRTMYRFFNPKVGINAIVDKFSSVYVSYSIANREPTRDDFVASTPLSRPTSERLYDLEMGYKVNVEHFNFEAVIYHMNYENQLVLTGKLNDVGSYTRINTPNSYRKGIELLGEYKLYKTFKLFGNVTISRSKIVQFDSYVYEYFSYSDSIATHKTSYQNSDIAFSPNNIGVAGFQWKWHRNMELFVAQKFVGKQYLDNSQQTTSLLKAYTTMDVKLIYTSHPKWCRKWNVMLTLNNILNKRYVSNGYTYSSMYDGVLMKENFVYPQAGTNMMLTITLGF